MKDKKYTITNKEIYLTEDNKIDDFLDSILEDKIVVSKLGKISNKLDDINF